MDALTLAGLGVAAFAAGFIDAVAGGGGLISIPALFLGLGPATLPATVVGTNKVQSLAGMLAAAVRYARHHPVDWRMVAPLAALAFVCAVGGAWLVTVASPAVLRPLMVAILAAVAIYTFTNRGFGEPPAGPAIVSPARRAGVATAVGVIGVYTGFFGPGAGSLLLFLFVRGLRLGFLAASPGVKLVNSAMDLAAILLLGAKGHILWAVALPMAACNILGARLGARLAISRGNRFVRACFLAVVTVVLLKLGRDFFFGP